MLEKVDLSKNLTKKEIKHQVETLGLELSELQREAKSLGIPVMIIFEGWDAAGKGTMINRLIHPMDPRGFKVYTIHDASEEERMHPFLWRFWTKIPAKGRIHIFDHSWYRKVINERVDGQLDKDALINAYNEILFFEETLSVDNHLIIKLFLHISKKEQKKRFEKLEASPETKWRVAERDKRHHKQYDDYFAAYEDMIEKTDTQFAPWTIVEATDREYAEVKILSTVVRALGAKIAQVKAQIAAKAALQKEAVGTAVKDDAADISKIEQAETVEEKTENIQKATDSTKYMNSYENDPYRTTVLAGINPQQPMTKEVYKKRLNELQNRLALLHSEIYQKRIPVVIAFEGWDAGGKGGAIKRLTEYLDPRGYEVIPTAAPNDIEKAHHYLWRFWEAMPKAGHIAIFDRTWYGRVMVERIEKLCSEDEWKRAYKEINEMETHIANFGTIVLKFWLHIDKDEQERRFNERMNTPEKQWKITDEDWRNREKWPQYEIAVDEMILRTSTSYAPWIIVEGNNKYYARIKVLETVVEALEKRLKECK